MGADAFAAAMNLTDADHGGRTGGAIAHSEPRGCSTHVLRWTTMRDDGLGNNRSLEKLPNQGLLLTARYARGSRGPGRWAEKQPSRSGALVLDGDRYASEHLIPGRCRIFVMERT